MSTVIVLMSCLQHGYYFPDGADERLYGRVLSDPGDGMHLYPNGTAGDPLRFASLLSDWLNGAPLPLTVRDMCAGTACNPTCPLGLEILVEEVRLDVGSPASITVYWVVGSLLVGWFLLFLGLMANSWREFRQTRVAIAARIAKGAHYGIRTLDAGDQLSITVEGICYWSTPVSTGRWLPYRSTAATVGHDGRPRADARGLSDLELGSNTRPGHAQLLLYDVSDVFAAGTMTFIMGTSGSGMVMNCAVATAVHFTDCVIRVLTRHADIC